ncbi:MAG: DEAD/DEAH box helicase [Gemmataceae bacterium]
MNDHPTEPPPDEQNNPPGDLSTTDPSEVSTEEPADFPADVSAAAEPDRPPPEIPPEIRFEEDGREPVFYKDMKLIRPLADAIEIAGYKTCTPVQREVIPVAMTGKDVVGQAQTGTGKTAAFLIPFMNRWRPHTLKGPIGLIMCPTRELALQVANEANKLAPSKRFRTVPVYGGTGFQKQLDGLSRGCDLVVGTPGRMLDLLRRGSLSFDHVRYVVLDEADRMLDIGFRPDIERILKRCPDKRQTLLMSATVPDDIKRLVTRYLKDPVHLNLSPKVLTVDKIRQTYITVDADKKFDLLLKVIEREKPRQCIIFCERKRWSDKLYRQMKPHCPKTAVTHGDLPQAQRERIMAGFRTGQITYLIATDVASRGIDVTGLTHVINYDLPTDIENYVHRIGRTGRIGKDGVAIAFVTPEQGPLLTEIEMIINRLIDEDRIEGFEATAPRVRREDPVQPKALVTADGQLIAPDSEGTTEEPPPDSSKKTVFGKPTKRYSNRL